MNVRRRLGYVAAFGLGLAAAFSVSSVFSVRSERESLEEIAAFEEEVLPLRYSEVGRQLRDFGHAVGVHGRTNNLDTAHDTYNQFLKCSEAVIEQNYHIPKEDRQKFLKSYNTFSDTFVKNLEDTEKLEGANKEEFLYWFSNLAWTKARLRIAAERGRQSDEAKNFYEKREAELKEEYVTPVVLWE
ncbi:MAG: hypothetical protein KJ600_00030 [Nanoarchaeota archaeon]|nr:hypothetical protein [Nanoarchaeota archaeon]